MQPIDSLGFDEVKASIRGKNSLAMWLDKLRAPWSYDYPLKPWLDEMENKTYIRGTGSSVWVSYYIKHSGSLWIPKPMQADAKKS